MATDKLVVRSMSRKQLADEYGISDKTFRQRLRRAGLDFGTDRLLSATQVQAIVERLGPWTISLDQSEL